MKRYTIHTKVEKTVSEFELNWKFRGLSVIEENDNGEWVLWSDVEKMKEHLESQIPEKRIEKLERSIGLITKGKCPECEQQVNDYKPPLGFFAPEAFATLRENGINPSTGHKIGCSLSSKE